MGVMWQLRYAWDHMHFSSAQVCNTVVCVHRLDETVFSVSFAVGLFRCGLTAQEYGPHSWGVLRTSDASVASLLLVNTVASDGTGLSAVDNRLRLHWSPPVQVSERVGEGEGGLMQCDVVCVL